MVALGRQALVQVRREQRRQAALGACHGIPVRPVVVAAAQRTRPVAGSQGDGVVEEEDRSPAPRGGERMTPAPELRPARDPQRAAVVADDVSVIVDQAAPVPGQQTSPGRGVEVSERIDPVAPRHPLSLPSGRGSAAM
jgi:hypothetical protein